jgi:putative methyltransferase (TIGR04325 family)
LDAVLNVTGKESLPTQSLEGASPLRSLRLAQIRALACLLSHMGKRPRGQAILQRLSRTGLSPLMNALLGFRGSFESLDDAERIARRFIPSAHDHPDEIGFSVALAEGMRESDYPVLFLLVSIAPSLRRVFDLGGSIGNLLYSYDRHLHFSPEITWTVYDLPRQCAAGQAFARERGEKRIRFATDVKEGDGADLFIVSGALHYFEEPLYPLLSQFKQRPRHVIVNRSPFSRGPAICTVQDARTHLVACKLHGRDDFVHGMQELGYQLRATWPVFELEAWVPLQPKHCDRHYWGFYFVSSMAT